MSGLLSRFMGRGQRGTGASAETSSAAGPARSENDMTTTGEDWTTDGADETQEPLPANTTEAGEPGVAQEDEAFILSPIEVSLLQGEIIEQLRTIYDPEIPVNIFELGLIYDIAVTPDATVDITMTLTSPGCPVAGTLPPEVQDKAASVPGVKTAKVEVVWSPPWNMDMMSDEAKLELGLF
jgi:FeS assembly SUF system protein